MNSSTHSTESNSKAKHGRRLYLKLPLPLGEGWGEGRPNQTAFASWLAAVVKRKRVFFFCSELDPHPALSQREMDSTIKFFRSPDTQRLLAPPRLDVVGLLEPEPSEEE